MSTALVRTTQIVKVRRRQIDPAAPRRVSFFSYESDFLCPLLAAIGLYNSTIADITGLTEGQVMYRVTKFENAIRRKLKNGEKELTSRRKYRNGKGEVAQALIHTVTGTKSPVKSMIIATMEKKNLYSPRPKGVMKDR